MKIKYDNGSSSLQVTLLSTILYLIALILGDAVKFNDIYGRFPPIRKCHAMQNNWLTCILFTFARSKAGNRQSLIVFCK